MASRYSFSSIKTLTYGVEIETVGLSRQQAAYAMKNVVGGTVVHEGGCYDRWTCVASDGRKWTAMSDSSIVGYGRPTAEVVTPILRWEDMDTLQQVVRELRRAGARVNESCGMHVHVGADGFKADPKAIGRLAKITHKHEDVLFAMLATTDERRDRWCRPVRQDFLRRIESYRGSSLAAYNRAWYGRENNFPQHYDSTRYSALNLHNIWFRGTVEFRWFESTTHAGKVKAAVQLSLGLCAKALETKSASSKKRPFDASRGKWDARTCLIRLGLIGDEFKTCRLLLTRHLQGNSRTAPREMARAA